MHRFDCNVKFSCWMSRSCTLQAYNACKRLEHNLKAAVRDGNSVSAVHPAHYLRRCKHFLCKVFALAGLASAVFFVRLTKNI